MVGHLLRQTQFISVPQARLITIGKRLGVCAIGGCDFILSSSGRCYYLLPVPLLDIERVIMKLGLNQRLDRIFICQNLCIGIWYFSRHAFEDRMSQRKDFANFVFVLVFAFNYICVVWVIRRESGDIEKEAVGNIDESSVDDVGSVTTYPVPRPGIDIQQVTASDVELRAMVLVVGMVVLLTEFVQCCIRDLGIEIPILIGDRLAIATEAFSPLEPEQTIQVTYPWEYLTVPKPSQQRAMS